MQVALGPQKDALLRFGFEASLEGAGVAQRAIETAEPSEPRSAKKRSLKGAAQTCPFKAKAQASTRQRVGLQKRSDDVTRRGDRIGPDRSMMSRSNKSSA